MRKGLVVVLVLFSLYSCKREKIENTGDLLVGKWSWSYSEKIESACEPPSVSSIVTPNSENLNASVEFVKKGFFFYSNSELGSIQEYTVVSQTYYDTSIVQKDLSFSVGVYSKLSKETIWLDGSILNDTLRLSDFFPFEDQYFNEGSSICATYTNYFVRD